MGRGLLRAIATAAFGVLIGQAACAAEIRSATTKSGTNLIFLIGDIGNGDEEVFKREASKFSEALVFLESNGGATAAAIEIGETIRLKGFATAVVNGSDCYSACGLIWLAGAPRTIARTARVGLHASYTGSGTKASESGVGNAIVGRYLTLLNLPEKAIVFATSAPPNSLNWVTAANYKSLGIDVDVVDDVNFEDDSPSQKQTSSKAASNAETELWANSGFWSVYIDHTYNDSCFLLATYDNGTSFRIGFDNSDGSYLLISNEAWASLREGKSTSFQLSSIRLALGP